MDGLLSSEANDEWLSWIRQSVIVFVHRHGAPFSISVGFIFNHLLTLLNKASLLNLLCGKVGLKLLCLTKKCLEKMPEVIGGSRFLGCHACNASVLAGRIETPQLYYRTQNAFPPKVRLSYGIPLLLLLL